MHDHLFESLPIAGSQRGHTATGVVVGQENADLMVVKDLKAGFGDVGVDLVPKAAGEESHFDAAFAHGRIHVADRAVQRLCRQLGHVAVAEHGLQQRCANRVLRLGLVLEDEVLERRAQAQQRAEQPRIGEQHPECGLLDGREPQIGRHDGPRLKENIGRFHARGAVCLARAAEEAPRQLFVHGLGVFDDTMGKVFDKSDLPAGEVAFDTRRHIHGTKRLTEPALHAGRQFVVQSHQGIGKLGKLIHGPFLPE